MNTDAKHSAPTLTSGERLTSWALQIAAAGILASTLPFKYSAAEESVRLFEELGAGAAGRLGTAILETIAVVLLLSPRFAGLGGLMVVGLMSGAILGHLTILGIQWDGDAGLFAMAVTAWCAGLGIVWLRRHQLPFVGPRLFPRPKVASQ